MVYCTFADINTFTNITSSDVADADITTLIGQATKELNAKINTEVVREFITWIDNTRQNKIDGSKTTYYVQNWHGKFLADRDNDGGVDTGDVIVYQVTSEGTETKLTISAIDSDDGNITLDSAPESGVRLFITYSWAYKDPSTPDELIKLACINLTAAYCYAKINIGRAVRTDFGNTRIIRHMDSFKHYHDRYLDLVRQVNSKMIAGYRQSTETV